MGALARALSTKLGVKILSPEFEILLTLYDHGDLSAGELQVRSGVSSTAFYARLKLLAAAGHLRLAKDQDDRRVSVYALTAGTERILDESFRALGSWAGCATGTQEHPASFDWHDARICNRLDLNLLSPEFRVIMNIYDSEPISTTDLFYKSRLANSRFYAVLTLLAGRRMIRSLIDPDDRRRRLYCLPRGVRSQLDELLRDFRGARPQPASV